MWRAVTLRIGIYSQVPRTRTLANSNLALTRAKINFPWISFIQYSVTRTLENSNIPVTHGQSNFCFPTNDFYLILPSIKSDKSKKTSTMRHWIYCKTAAFSLSVLLCQSCSNAVSSPDHEYSIFKFCCPWSEMYIASCIPSPTICLFPYFRLFASNSR